MIRLTNEGKNVWVLTYQRNLHSEIKTLFVGRHRRAARFYLMLIKEWD